MVNKYEVPIICVSCIVKHGKGKVDHVGGLAKTIIRRAIVTGEFFENITCMIDFLEQKYKDKKNPTCLKEIDSTELCLLRTKAKLKIFKTVLGSNTFQVMVFHPFSHIIKASA